MVGKLQWKEELGKLDELAALLAQAPPSPDSTIAQEHVQSARSCVWEAMRDEYEFELKLARTAIGNIEDADTRQNAQRILDAL